MFGMARPSFSGIDHSVVTTEKDKVPGIGDIPILGRFSSQTKSSVKKNLMIFVTPTIVDPAGNRVHSDDELPFAAEYYSAAAIGSGRTTETTEKVTMPKTMTGSSVGTRGIGLKSASKAPGCRKNLWISCW